MSGIGRFGFGRPWRAGSRRRIRLAASALHLVLAAAVVLGGTVFGGSQPTAAQDGGERPQVLRTIIDDSITPVIAEHLDEVVDRAEDQDYNALVVEMDTPGGLDTSMRKIIQRFLASEVPIVVYVSPEGARAASAGSMIALSSHVVAMAPGTAIGAATPVQLGGGGDGDEGVSDSDRKAINDAAALAESLAERRDRNVEFAVDTVREGRSASANEAVDIGAVDLIASSLTELLDEIDGQTVEVAPDDRVVTLDTANANIDDAELGLFRQIQQFLADPNLAFLFLSVGTLGLIYELVNPGVSGAGVVGAILIILAMFGIAVLPVNAVGLLMLLLAAGLFVAELFAPGIGVAAAGGTGALVLGGIFMFRGSPAFEVSMAVIAPVALVVGGAVIVAGRLVVRSRKATSTTTGEGLFVDRTVKVERVSDQQGMAFVEGAWWTVRSSGPPLEAGEARVVAVEGLTLLVEPVAGPGREPPAPDRDDDASPAADSR